MLWKTLQFGSIYFFICKGIEIRIFSRTSPQFVKHLPTATLTWKIHYLKHQTLSQLEILNFFFHLTFRPFPTTRGQGGSRKNGRQHFNKLLLVGLSGHPSEQQSSVAHLWRILTLKVVKSKHFNFDFWCTEKRLKNVRKV